MSLNKNIQSVTVINRFGRSVEELKRDGFLLEIPETSTEMLLMQCVLQISMGRDFDEQYGPISYHVSERENMTMMTFPMDEHIVLVITKKNLSPISLARKISGVLTNQRIQLISCSPKKMDTDAR